MTRHDQVLLKFVCNASTHPRLSSASCSSTLNAQVAQCLGRKPPSLPQIALLSRTL